jgi:hypothetical protein
MTNRKITNSLNKIETCLKNGYVLEALLRNYHLNIDLIKLILINVKPDYSFEGKKFKTVMSEFQHEISVNAELKPIINKKTFKLVKTWLVKMDSYFKKLKFEEPANTKLLMSETQKIVGVLNISANKLFSRIKA